MLENVKVDTYILHMDFVLSVLVQPPESIYDPKAPKIKEICLCSWCTVMKWTLYSSCKHGRKAKVGVIDNRCSFQPLSLQICPVTSDWLGIGSRCTREAP